MRRVGGRDGVHGGSLGLACRGHGELGGDWVNVHFMFLPKVTLAAKMSIRTGRVSSLRARSHGRAPHARRMRGERNETTEAELAPSQGGGAVWQIEPRKSNDFSGCLPWPARAQDGSARLAKRT